MANIADYTIKRKRLGHWAAILEEWILAIDRYTRVTGGDAPYWYTERANIGVLSAAAWRCGCIALEEFQYEKIDVSSADDTVEEAQRKWNGRCDLWIVNQTKSEIVEAKFRWINMLSDKVSEFAVASLTEALKDVQRTRGVDSIDSIGVAFLPVYVKANKLSEPKTMDEVINSTITSMKKIDADLVAWCFPERLRSYVSELYGNALPGVVMLAKKLEK